MQAQSRPGRFALTASFVLFLLPITVDSFGVNYSFVLLPALVLLVRQRLTPPPTAHMALIVLYAVIFCVAAIYQHEFYADAPRRTVSFLLFMSVFAYAFMPVDAAMANSFKRALVWTSLAMAGWSALIWFASYEASFDLEDAKNLVGSQRIGFIYLLAFWVLVLDHDIVSRRSYRYAALALILLGILFTFSRSSVIALMMSVALFSCVSVWRWLQRPSFVRFLRGFGIAMGMLGVLSILYLVAPVTFDFFQERLIEYLLDPEVRAADLEDEQSSGGTRAHLLRLVLDFVSANPVTGSGFLGVWAANPDAGSAHNQYLDVLFRTGVIGFLAYCYLLVTIGIHLKRHEPALFWGYVAVVVYGIFHETFKEPNGSFVLAFLIGMVATTQRKLKPGGTQLRSLSEPTRVARTSSSSD